LLCCQTNVIVDKTVMVFDDWYSFTEGRELGQQRALNEFKQRNKQLKFEPVLEYPRYGKMFIARTTE
jgi:O-methyltransferase